MMCGLAVDNTRDLSVGNILNRVGATSVLKDADVVIIRNSGNRTVDDILKDAAIFDGVENIRLLLRREVDALGITSALNVEDTIVRPHMLVVTDEMRRLLGSAESVVLPVPERPKKRVTSPFSWQRRSGERVDRISRVGGNA